MKLKNSIRALCLTCFAASLTFSSCEKKPLQIKDIYIDHDIEINGIKDPIVNIPWLASIQEYNNKYSLYPYNRYAALLLFTAIGDSTQSIYDYKYKPDDRYYTSPIINIYNLDGTHKFNNCPSSYPYQDDLNCVTSLASKETQSLIHSLIEAKLSSANSNVYTDTIITRATNGGPDIPEYYEVMDTILYNAINVKVIYCHRITKK